MKSFIRIILFLFTFTIEIKVKAAIVHREPVACDKVKSTECLLFSGRTGGKVKLPNVNVYLGRETLLFRDSRNDWHLVRGVVKLESRSQFNIFTLAGRFELEKAEAVLQQIGQRSNLFVLSGKVMPIMNSPVSKPYFLTEAYVNWFGPINSMGFNEEGLPRPLVWKQFASQIGFENWYLIIKEKQKIKNNQIAAIDNISLFYLNMFKAMEKNRFDRETTEENRQRAIASEASEVRQLFKNKFRMESLDE